MYSKQAEKWVGLLVMMKYLEIFMVIINKK